ncbi:SUMF1/EgtB/PvdO family nonheme iron enzyme [Blautia sp. MSJ-9]|uniref:SUMF1/EgtB/PvdO family nonheme iron enzyme n=1 Tax=Blautia sp. MSJ-9 TaxID=2841511 RepID=UPI001C128FE1|nr:SUMF1/EgtB/PvdO family nonheme iron enzyme [Blautia sp. MSJ-9]MBU5680084.1 formylglycine-generating enzyme family protein [Blautia sp. MSJ-9]
MPNFDDLKLSIEALSGGKNTVLFDDLGMPSIMVPFPKMKMSDLITGGSENVHPAFIINGVEKDVLYVSKFQNIVLNERAYSLPMRDPRASVNFDQAVNFCRNKGKSWGLMPYALWSAIALWCRKNSTMPRGNNNYGCDHAYTHEKGVPTYYESGKIARCATGSGPNTWSHNWMPDGIFDLNGNVWEWCAGMRLVNGEIQVIPYSNCMSPDVSLGASSTFWKAIAADGSLVEPGTAGTLKWDVVSGKIQLTKGDITPKDQGNWLPYNNMTLGDGLTVVPELAKALLLYPDEPNGDYGGDYHGVNTSGERLPICGGGWDGTGTSGVFYVNSYNSRSNSDSSIGLRSASE